MSKSRKIMGVILLVAIIASFGGNAYASDADWNTVMNLLRLSPESVNIKTSEGDTLLHAAASQGKTDIVRELLSYGADVNAKNNDGITPIHNAAVNNNGEIVKILVSKGASVNIREKNGLTALHLVAFDGNESMTRLLIASGADVNARGSDHQITPLRAAQLQGNTRVANLLKLHGGIL
jgi:ankyrin repeat protein